MNRTSLLRRNSLLTAMVASGALGIAGAAIAADTYPPTTQAPGATTTTQPMAQPMAPAKAMAPSKSELPDAAFKKLDASGKGYVTQDEAKTLDGFDQAFKDNDRNHDGRLTQDEFKNAWEEYSGKRQ